MSFANKLEELERKKQLLVAEESIFMRKALQSDNPNDLVKAMKMYEQRDAQSKGTMRSIFVDPYNNIGADGYLNTPRTVPPDTLRRMAKGSPIINSIIATYLEKVADFMEPQSDKNTTGFIIEKKQGWFNDDKKELTKEDKQKIELITEFLLRGCMSEELDDKCDDLNTWSRKVVRDSLVIDQLTTEIVYNNVGTLPMGFVANDAATFFFADNYSKDGRFEPQTRGQKLPKYVQVYQGKIINEFFDEELMFGVRNPQTAMYTNGYGESELEILISTVTSMLQGDAYNANIFKIGSVPSGIMRVQGQISETRLQEFKSQWTSEMVGYQNRGRLAFLEAEKMEFIDMSKSNRDMEYSKYQEYLIKLACAVYKISPEEVGFTVQGTGSSSLNQDSGEARLQYSRDKGLKPLLTFLQRLINDKIVSKIDNNFRFKFVGLEPDNEDKDLERLMKKAQTYMGYKEIRESMGLSAELDEDDMIANPVIAQFLMQEKQAKMMGNPESNEFMDQQESDNPFEKSWKSNPMAKDFEEFVDKELINN